MIRNTFLSLATGLLLASCSTMPDPAKSKYVTTEGAGFGMGQSELFYGITYTLNQQFSEKVYITIEFENPSNPSSPFIVKKYIPVGVTSFPNESPKFRTIRNNTNYSVVLRLYRDPNYTQLFATHTDQVRFSVPPEIMKIKGITELK